MTATTVEQSEHFVKLGVPLESADMIWKEYHGKNEDGDFKYYDLDNVPFRYYSGIAIPAWSLESILDLLPLPLLTQNSDSTWSCAIYPNGKQLHVDFLKSPLEAAYKAVCKLKESQNDI